MKLSERLLEIARGAIGMSADPSAKMPDGSSARDAFEALMGYGETAAVKRAMSSYHDVSTCGLFVRGALWAVGFQPAAMRAPYVAGSVFTTLLALGRDASAWVEAPTKEFAVLPDPGDLVMVGLEGKAGHVFLVEEVTLKGRYKVVVRTIEAGQVAVQGGYQCVVRKEHTWAIGAGGFIDTATKIDGPDIFPGSGRRLSGWIRTAALERGPALEITTPPRRITPPPIQAVTTPVVGTTTPAFVISTPGNPTLEGVDVSFANQGAIDWERVARAGIKFVVVKAGEGSEKRGNYEDGSCAAHCAGARRAGLELGLYHYLRTRVGESDTSRDQDALDQAESFARIHDRERPSFIWCDVEDTGNAHAGPTQVIYTHGFWSTHVERLTGKRPILYSFDGYLALLGFPHIPGADRWKLARANYSAPFGTAAPEPWGKGWLFWQHSASPPANFTGRSVDAAGVEWAVSPAGARSRLGRVDGIPGYVDRSTFRGDLSALRTL